jgi:predicted FMN-binding regulatory protein PaiB
MSQNREMKDRKGVASGLLARGEGDDLQMAALVSGEITRQD